jgi:hypothetical protein
MGFSITLSTVYYSLSAYHALLASSFTIATVLALSVTAAMALYRIPFWIPGFLGTIGLAVSAIAAAVSPDVQAFWIAALVTLALVAVAGLGVLISSIE